MGWAHVWQDGGLTQVTPIGDVGDPTTVIIRAAHHDHADVRHRLSHLLDRSVERELLRHADFAVLVAAEPPISRNEASAPFDEEDVPVPRNSMTA